MKDCETQAIEKLKKYYQQRDLAAREWKRNGGKVIGYFCDNVPVELILAAGFFPFRLSGDPWGDTNKVDKYTFSCEEFVRSMINMLLTGKYDFLDFLIIPHARTSIHNTYMFLLGLKQYDHSVKIPELYFLDNLHTTFYSAEIYNRERWLSFKKKLEEWSGREIKKESLSQAIAITNENKRLLKKIAYLRASEPPCISGVEALQIIGSSMFMFKEEHNKLLRQLLADTNRLSARDGIRLFISGSPLDNLQLYEIIESCNAIIVAEDHCWGNRSFDVPIDTTLEPLEAIFDRYHNKSPCSRMFPISRRIEYSLSKAIEAKAQGVIFYVFESDDAEAWEVPDKRKALAETGIPSLYLKKQSYLITEQKSLENNIQEFINSVGRR